MDRADKLEKCYDALRLAAETETDILEEAMALLESDEPETYTALTEQFSPSKGWRG